MKRRFSDHQLKQYYNRELSSDQMKDMEKKFAEDDLAFLDLLFSRDLAPIHTPFEKKLKSAKIQKEKLPSPSIPEDELDFGMIFSTKVPVNWKWPHQSTRLVMIIDPDPELEGYNDILIAPISFETQFRTEGDVIIDGPPLQMPFMVRMSHTTPMFSEQLGDYWGQIDEKYDDLLKEAWHKAFTGLGNVSEEVYHFIRRENQLTDYLRVPVHMVKQLTELYPDDMKVLDTSYLIPEEFLKEMAEEILRQGKSDDSMVPVAADAALNIKEVFAGEARRRTLISNEEMVISIIAKEQSLHLEIDDPEKQINSIEFSVIDKKGREIKTMDRTVWDQETKEEEELEEKLFKELSMETEQKSDKLEESIVEEFEMMTFFKKWSPEEERSLELYSALDIFPLKLKKDRESDYQLIELKPLLAFINRDLLLKVVSGKQILSVKFRIHHEFFDQA